MFPNAFHGLPAQIGALVVFSLMSTAAIADPFSDNFDGSTINPGWTVASPNPDSTYGLTGKGKLNLTASPLNGGSDLYPGTNYNAPVILQPVPADTNWTISTKITIEPTNDYQSVGMLLATQPGGFTDTSQFLRVAEHFFYPPQVPGGEGIGLSGGDSFAYTGKVAYFRVTKLGSAKKGWTYESDFSPDGKTWTFGGVLQSNIAYTYFGLHSIRYVNDNDFSVYTSANFSYFKVKLKGH